jgi:integrase
MAEKPKRSPTGIRCRHSRSCHDPTAERCGCTKAWQAWVWSKRDHRKLTRTFTTLADAKAWRADAQTAVRKRTLRPATKITLAEAASSWVAGAKAGLVRTRGGDVYKPATLRAYEAALAKGVLDELGSVKLSEISRLDLQDLVDRWLAAGMNPRTIAGRIMPVRAVYRRAMARGDISVSPTSGLTLPAGRGGRERIASPDEAAQLVAALAREHRALWATALYAGLRRGELQALRWRDVDLAGGVVRVERGWDAVEGPIAPKTRKGRRRVPVAAVLRDHLAEHRQRLGDVDPDELVFGRTATVPFRPGTVTRAADRAWKAAGLDRVCLHECRHTFASLMIDAGVNVKALSTFCGHANISITLDLYGHLLPGSEDEAAARLDAYLEAAAGRARAAAPDTQPDVGLARVVARAPLSDDVSAGNQR